MKVTTPSISWHNRERISSIDFQSTSYPNGKYRRLASAGDDKHVVIWDYGEKLNCLADLSRHQNSVNVVRWSRDGKTLASGDTDSAIFLWQYRMSSSAPDLWEEEVEDEGGDEDWEGKENWSVWKILRGHLQDVVSLAWSSCGQFLVSSSTDNSAIIFDVNKGLKLKILGEHKGWVNGVAFDPLGKYISSICSDRVLRLYDAKTHKLLVKTYKAKLPIAGENGTEEKVVRFFHDDTFQSFYRRVDFSPDGQLLVIPSGVLEIDQEPSVSHCTYVFSRTNFHKPVLYLPNKEFSVAVRFCPLLFKLRPVLREDAPTGEEIESKPWEKIKTLFALPYRMIYAVATQNTVMFYDTQQAAPFARVSKIHYIGLTDVSWSEDGHTCIVSSTDGYATFIEFKKGELGQVYTPNEKQGLKEMSINLPTKHSTRDSGNNMNNKTIKDPSLIKNDSFEAVKKVSENKSSFPTVKEEVDKISRASALEANVIQVKKKPSKKDDNSMNISGLGRHESTPMKSAHGSAEASLIPCRKAPKKTGTVISNKLTENADGAPSPKKALKEEELLPAKSAAKETPSHSEVFSSTNKSRQDALECKDKAPNENLSSQTSCGGLESSKTITNKAPKRVQLVTLSVPPKHSEEEEDLKLFLEDDKTQEEPMECDKRS